jgi:GT2 family glycosyltransferase
MKMSSLSVVIVARDGERYLEACLASVYGQQRGPDQVFVIDNGSTDGGAELVARRYKSASVIRLPRNLGVAGGLNVGLHHSRGSVVVFLNQDVVLDPSCLGELEEAILRNASWGICGSKLLYPASHIIQHAGGVVELPLYLTKHRGYGRTDNGQYDSICDVEYVTGAVLAAKRALLNWLGGFDERFFPAYYEDLDLCRRVRQAGFHVVYVPKAVAYHWESASTLKGSRRFLNYYHLNRLRFAIGNFLSDEDAARFVQLESARTKNLSDDVERTVLEHIYSQFQMCPPQSKSHARWHLARIKDHMTSPPLRLCESGG